jgi:hypothetical protein
MSAGEASFEQRSRVVQFIIDTMPPVSRRDRYVDLAALLIIVIGLALYLDSSSRFHAILAFSFEHPGPRGQSQLAAADRARYESYGALALAIFGCVTGAVSALRHKLRPVS